LLFKTASKLQKSAFYLRHSVHSSSKLNKPKMKTMTKFSR